MEHRTCADCRAVLTKKPGPGRWPVRCIPCRKRRGQHAAYRRLRDNPEKWAAYLAKRRAEYEPKPSRVIRTCDQPGCELKHLALGMCRKHYRAWTWANRNEQPNPIVIISGMASLHGAYFPKPKPIKVRVAVGAMAFCPWCDAHMNAISPTRRFCLNCGTTVRLNAEEVSWAISEKRSTAA